MKVKCLFSIKKLSQLQIYIDVIPQLGANLYLMWFFFWVSLAFFQISYKIKIKLVLDISVIRVQVLTISIN